MFGYSFVWRQWALTTYSSTKVDGPGRWVYCKTLYWEWRSAGVSDERGGGKKVYYTDEAMSAHEADEHSSDDDQ